MPTSPRSNITPCGGSDASRLRPHRSPHGALLFDEDFLSARNGVKKTPVLFKKNTDSAVIVRSRFRSKGVAESLFTVTRERFAKVRIEEHRGRDRAN
jgi:hypothetical protein